MKILQSSTIDIYFLTFVFGVVSLVLVLVVSVMMMVVIVVVNVVG